MLPPTEPVLVAMAVATAAVALVEAATATLVDLEASPPGGRGPYCIHLRFFPNYSGKDLSEHITTKAPGCARCELYEFIRFLASTFLDLRF